MLASPSHRQTPLLQVIAELALGTAGEDRTAQFAFVYDNRESVELRCGQCGDNSRLASMMKTVDLDIERRALRCPFSVAVPPLGRNSPYVLCEGVQQYGWKSVAATA